MDDFGSRLHQAICATKTVLCVGVDPHPSLMPEIFGGSSHRPTDAGAIAALENFCDAVLEAVVGRIPAIKPQVAFFEAYGPEGLAVLKRLSAHARAEGLLVIMDAKRGDIGSTATAYAEAWLGADSVFGSDALTINPYLGLDSLTPFITSAQKSGAGLFILVRTSNAGSADIQQQISDGQPVWQHVAQLLADSVTAAQTAGSPLSPIGVVMGATGPDEARLLRAELPSAPFLIPGYGAQGASAADACSGLFRDENGQVTGGIVNASRGITHTESARSAVNIAEYKRLVSENITRAISELAL